MPGLARMEWPSSCGRLSPPETTLQLHLNQVSFSLWFVPTRCCPGTEKIRAFIPYPGDFLVMSY